eukprot:GHVP01028835.1.p1 GENE.GHVP01028835.1~~GHVP01028835.1.p1  ORF type:complete len:104 (+),score=1.34 GHVP01028835.1:2060-2371(+)
MSLSTVSPARQGKRLSIWAAVVQYYGPIYGVHNFFDSSSSSSAVCLDSRDRLGQRIHPLRARPFLQQHIFVMYDRCSVSALAKLLSAHLRFCAEWDLFFFYYS